jgi:hypothetical protein
LAGEGEDDRQTAEGLRNVDGLIDFKDVNKMWILLPEACAGPTLRQD